MDAESVASEKEASRDLLNRECDTLLSEISRLEMSRDMQNKRLKNVMNLVSPSGMNVSGRLIDDAHGGVIGVRDSQYRG
jgi:hypothetical protein